MSNKQTPIDDASIEQRMALLANDIRKYLGYSDEIAPIERVAELEKSNRNLADRIACKDADIDNFISALVTRDEELVGALREHSRLQTEISDLRKHAAELKAKNERQAECIARQDLKLVETTRELGRREREIERLRDELARQRVTERGRVIGAVNAGLDDAQKEIERLKSDAAIKDAAIKSLRTEMERSNRAAAARFAEHQRKLDFLATKES